MKVKVSLPDIPDEAIAMAAIKNWEADDVKERNDFIKEVLKDLKRCNNKTSVITIIRNLFMLGYTQGFDAGMCAVRVYEDDATVKMKFVEIEV
jgi:hypothetical protein